MRVQLICAVLTALGKVVSSDLMIYYKDGNVSLPLLRPQSYQDRRSFHEFFGFGRDNPAEVTALPTSKPKCSAKALLTGKCKLSDIFAPQTPAPSTESPTTTTGPDRNHKAQIFNLGAFIIALFVSLAIALTGAFACWCFRTFLKKGTRRNPQDFGTPSAPPPDDNGMVMETLVRPSDTFRPVYTRNNSLPSYSTATAHVPYKPALQDEPPPAYHSLFATNGVS